MPLLLRWGSWVTTALDLMDGDGAFKMSYEEQRAMPAYDAAVLRRIRGEWVRLRNEDMKRKMRV